MADDAVLNVVVKQSGQGKAISQAGDDITKMAKDADAGRKLLTATGAAIAAVGVGITAFAKNATDYTVGLVGETKKMSRETGLATDAASRLVYVTGRLGIDAGAASVSFGKFSKQITETAQAANPAETALGQLGVKVQNADGSIRDFNTILLETADRFKGMPDGPQKTALALELFGKSGKDMIKVLNLGSDGIKDLQKRADELGLTLNSKTIGAVSNYVQSQKDLQDSTNALKIAVGTLTTPVLTRFNQTLNQVTSSLINASGPFKGVLATTLAFGGPILSAGGGLIAFAANAKTAGINMAAIIAAGRALLGFLTGPWGIALMAATAVVGFLAAKLWNKKAATDSGTTSAAAAINVEQELSTTMSELATSASRAKQAQDALNGAQFDAVGAGLQVEAAQRRYNEAVRDYGPKSLEARQASYDLEGAKRRLEDANNKVSAAQTLQNQAEGYFVLQTPAVQNSIQLRINKLSEVAGMAWSATNAVAVLDGRLANLSQQGMIVAGNLQNAFGNIQGSMNTVQKTFGDLQGRAITLQGSVANINQSASRGIPLGGGGATSLQGVPLRAHGGPVTAGRPYWVGDNPDGSLNKTSELFVPKQSGTVVPAAQAQGGGDINITQYNTFVRETDPMAFARLQAFELRRR